jgi:hypothetical protein
LPENLVLDNTGQNDAANFQRTLKGMTYSAEVSEAILKMQAATITVDHQPPLKSLNTPGRALEKHNNQ